MKLRLDKAVHDLGLTKSRDRAKALIMEGKVLVNGQLNTKAGSMVKDDVTITLKGNDIPYVSRGGLKLRAVIDEFKLDVSGMVAMDVGASTGGFTDCLLQNGVSHVYCVDVGYGQLDWKLRQDERITMLERTNIRHLERDKIPHDIDIAVIDVSFISLRLVMPKVREFLKKSEGIIVALIKPQFEVGRADVGKGGIVRDDNKREQAVDGIKEFTLELGMDVFGVIQSPIKGQKGNIEYLIYCKEKS